MSTADSRHHDSKQPGQRRPPGATPNLGAPRARKLGKARVFPLSQVPGGASGSEPREPERAARPGVGSEEGLLPRLPGTASQQPAGRPLGQPHPGANAPAVHIDGRRTGVTQRRKPEGKAAAARYLDGHRSRDGWL